MNQVREDVLDSVGANASHDALEQHFSNMRQRVEREEKKRSEDKRRKQARQAKFFFRNWEA